MSSHYKKYKKRKGKVFKLAPRGNPLLRVPYHPLVHHSGTSSILVRSIRHHSPRPDSSRNLRKCCSHLGLANKTRTPSGSSPSHAFTLMALSRSLEQWRRTWDLDIRTLPRQNQHLSSCLFPILFRYSADLQWPVRICAVIRASAFLTFPNRISWEATGYL